MRDAVYRKVAWRLLPFLVACYAIAYLDRVNIGFAKLRMSGELGFSETVYGLGAGIFFLGYFLFEVPSNVMLHRLGARTWIARIMISWAIVSAACAWVENPVYFYIARFLLGVAEAGFFPGVILYLTYWFPAARRGRIVALFMAAIPLSGLVGGPVSGLVMDLFDGFAGWSGWRWMFVVEAAPALLLGLAVPFVLVSRVEQATWLSADEKALIQADLAADDRAAPAHGGRLRDLFADPRLLRLSGIYFCCVMGQYGVTFWLPTMLASAGGDSPWIVGLLSFLPYACAVTAMVVVGRRSDLTGERHWHLALPMFVGAAALALAPYAGGGAVVSVALLCVAAAAVLTATPLFWNLPTSLLTGMAAAVGIAIINSIGNLAGFVSPLLVGWITDQTGSIGAGMLLLGFILLLGGSVVLATRNTALRPAEERGAL